MRALVSLSVLAVLVLAGCSSGDALAGRMTGGSAFDASIHQAAVVDTSQTTPLLPIQNVQARVVTWVPERFRGSFTVGDTTSIPADSWVTLDPQVQELCQSVSAAGADSSAVYLRVQQYLGLAPSYGARFFATLTVDSDDVFRPCADPAVYTTSCSWNFPAGVADEHVEWVANQALAAYRTPGGAPWTRMGYTYDWGSASHVGASEYVIRKGATFRVEAVAWTADYCAAPR